MQSSPPAKTGHFDKLNCPLRKATKSWIAQVLIVRAMPEARRRKLPESCSGPIRLDFLFFSEHKLSSFFSHHLIINTISSNCMARIMLLVFQLLQGASVGHFKQCPVHSLSKTNLNAFTLTPGGTLYLFVDR